VKSFQKSEGRDIPGTDREKKPRDPEEKGSGESKLSKTEKFPNGGGWRAPG